LRTLLPTTGLPAILVSPPPPEAWRGSEGIAERIRELITGTERITDFAQMPSGVFRRDGAVVRFIDGEMGARWVANTEFEREPAILVYFEHSQHSLTAYAYLSTVFGSVGGDLSFPFTIARYVRTQPGGPAVSAKDGDLPAWHSINLAAFAGIEPAEVVAYTITWFLLAVVDNYWRLKSGIDPGLLAQFGVGEGRATADRPRTEAITERAEFLPAAPSRRARLELDARQLADNGFEVTAEELDGGYVGLHVEGVIDVIFVVDATYPDAPPAVIQVDGVDVSLDATGWSSECTLTDIVEALR